MQQHNPPPPDPASAASAKQPSSDIGDDVLAVLGKVEDQLNRLRSVRKDHDDAMASISAHSKAAKDSEGQLEKARKLLETERAEFEAERKRIEALAKQCQKQQKELDSKSALASEQQELKERVEKAERNVGELIQQLEATAQELAAKGKDLKKAGAETARLHKRIGQLEESLAEAEKQTAGSAEAEKRVQALEAEAAQLKAQLADSHQKLQRTGKKLSEFAQVLSEQTPELERGAAAIAMVDQQQEQIEHLTKQLAEVGLGSDPVEIQRRDQRIADLTEALRQARGQNGGQQEIAELERRNAQLTHDLDRFKMEAENALVALDAAKRQLKEQAAAISAPVGQDASLAGYAAKVAALTAEIEQTQVKAASDMQAHLDAQAKRHQKDLAEARIGDSRAMQELRDRVAQLQNQLREARSNASAGGDAGGGGADDASYATSLDEKAERITAIADHLRRRRARLIKTRQLVRERKAGGVSLNESLHTDEIRRIEQEKLQLAEVRKMLEVSERKMMRRWARSRATVSLGWVAMTLIVCAVLSWFAADAMFPAVRSASVSLEAKSPGAQQLTEDQAEIWRTWIADMLKNTAFHQTLAKRMAERRLDEFSDAKSVANRLKSDLTIDSSRNGWAVLTLAGTDKSDLLSFLDVLTASLLAESSRQATKMPSTIKTVVPGEKREGSKAQFASMNQRPIKDNRVRYAMPIFGGMFIVCLVMIVVGYRQFMKAKRVFDDQGSQYFVD